MASSPPEAKRELEQELTEFRSEKATLVDELEKASAEPEQEQSRSTDVVAQLSKSLQSSSKMSEAAMKCHKASNVGPAWVMYGV